ncbi:hypothetical protein GCM10027186_17540 [Micromonospora schwarzwaldensis]
MTAPFLSLAQIRNRLIVTARWILHVLRRLIDLDDTPPDTSAAESCREGRRAFTIDANGRWKVKASRREVRLPQTVEVSISRHPAACGNHTTPFIGSSYQTTRGGAVMALRASFAGSDQVLSRCSPPTIAVQQPGFAQPCAVRFQTIVWFSGKS